MKIKGNVKKGASIILLMLVIIVTIVIFTIIATSLDNSVNMIEDSQKEFNSSLTAYTDELSLYIDSEMKNEDKNFIKEEFFVYGENLRNVIPYIKEEDLVKFAIKRGKLVYVGSDDLERKWYEEFETMRGN